MLISVFFLLPEVESGIDAQRTKGVADAEVLLVIIISVEDQHGTCEILSGIVDNGCPRDEIQIEILCPAFILAVKTFDVGVLVADARKERNARQPGLGQHPIVSISEA